MRDGVVLAADVHRPASGGEIIEGALPVLLQRTPYNKASEARIEEATFFAANGYVTVMQDCRGRFESEGEEGCCSVSDFSPNLQARRYFCELPSTS